MTLNDVSFLISALAMLVVAVCALGAALTHRRVTARRIALTLTGFACFYAAILAASGLARPRRLYPPGHQRCFDDWCVTVENASPADSSVLTCAPVPGKTVWIAAAEVSSVAKRVRQRARDAHVEMEDGAG